MSVYVDDMRLQAQVGRIKARWSHLTADSDEELHEFAKKLGLKRSWFQEDVNFPGFNHYDVTDSMRIKAIQLGAIIETAVESVNRITNRE